MWPTPTVNDSNNSCFSQSQVNRNDSLAKRFLVEAQKNGLERPDGQLNPDWVEWLMGYEQMFTTTLLPTPRASMANNSVSSRYWAMERERERERETISKSRRPNRADTVGQDWPDEPNVGRVAHGVPNRVDRLKCLGNAVVPQQFFPIFKAIADIEGESDE